VTLPPLRARKGTSPLWCRIFLRRFTELQREEDPGLAPGTLQALLRHDWPGNVRELENSIERAVVLAQGPFLTTDDLPPTVLGARPSDRPMSSLIPGGTWQEIEKQAILRTLEVVGGSTSRAAAMLGISTRTIQYRLQAVRAGARGERGAGLGLRQRARQLTRFSNATSGWTGACNRDLQRPGAGRGRAHPGGCTDCSARASERNRCGARRSVNSSNACCELHPGDLLHHHRDLLRLRCGHLGNTMVRTPLARFAWTELRSGTLR
jgi:hypothetical protein